MDQARSHLQHPSSPDLGGTSLGERGLPDVATVHVLRVGDAEDALVEVVDGLDPPQPRRQKWIVNVSTQLGCPVGCPFCDAGGHYRGNLTAEHMLAQVRWVLDRHPGEAASCAKLKVHFARMGEPALNDAVLAALRQLPALVASPGLWACVASVAPRQRGRWFEQLLSIKDELYQGRFQLQLSVNSTDPATRARLIPVPHWDLDEIARYGARFHRPRDRKVVLNFALARAVPFEPAALLQRFDPAHFAIKLTPVNPTARGQSNGFETLLRSPGAAQLDEAIATLQAQGFDVLLSVGDPLEDVVGSNCGQSVAQLVRARRPMIQ